MGGVFLPESDISCSDPRLAQEGGSTTGYQALVPHMIGLTLQLQKSVFFFTHQRNSTVNLLVSFSSSDILLWLIRDEREANFKALSH